MRNSLSILVRKYDQSKRSFLANLYSMPAGATGR